MHVHNRWIGTYQSGFELLSGFSFPSCLPNRLFILFYLSWTNSIERPLLMISSSLFFIAWGSFAWLLTKKKKKRLTGWCKADLHCQICSVDVCISQQKHMKLLVLGLINITERFTLSIIVVCHSWVPEGECKIGWWHGGALSAVPAKTQLATLTHCCAVKSIQFAQWQCKGRARYKHFAEDAEQHLCRIYCVQYCMNAQMR